MVGSGSAALSRVPSVQWQAPLSSIDQSKYKVIMVAAKGLIDAVVGEYRSVGPI